VGRSPCSVNDLASDGHEVEEYDINTALIGSLNSPERCAAIETGWEMDRQDIQLGGKLNNNVALVVKSFASECREKSLLLYQAWEKVPCTLPGGYRPADPVAPIPA
jgi:hypothetical protein